MNYHNHSDLIDRLAAEYVLGTLRGRARRRFEKLLSGSIPMRRAVQSWEQHLFWLSAGVEPVKPPERVWIQIANRIGASQAVVSAPPVTTSHLWQAIAATVAGIALTLGVLLVTRKPEVVVRVETQVEKQIVQAAHTAILADATAPIWVLNAYPGAGTSAAELRVRAVREIPLADNQSFELWMLPDSGSSPVSLGLMPRNGSAVLPLTTEQLRTLIATSKVAVSIEPAGGSPTGAPTGPIPYIAPLLHIA
jgi:anti-sigma-K factor RskA